MKNLFIISILLALTFFLGVIPAQAIYNPTVLPNNIFGIHIISENDIPAASELLNSTSNNISDWGYVTMVISQRDRNFKKWSATFKQLRLHHLIPIIRVATRVEGQSWIRPQENDLESWIEFLDSLPWPIQNRYVILFNEPNHAKEWGGNIDPDNYAKLVDKAIVMLKKKNDDFFVLPAGMDLYASNTMSTMEATRFWHAMENAVPGILSKFDGLTSHSYPSGNYSGLPDEKGRYSIVGYKWELDYLSNHFGVNPNLPVFITETGWAQNNQLSSDKIAQFFKMAFNKVWSQDSRVVAVTPFLLNYQDSLFSRFSWQKPNSDEFYPQYYMVKSMPKVKGKPLRVPQSQFGRLLVQEQKRLISRRQAYLFPQIFSN